MSFQETKHGETPPMVAYNKKKRPGLRPLDDIDREDAARVARGSLTEWSGDFSEI